MRKLTDREKARLHTILQAVEDNKAWHEGTAWRVNIIRFYGLQGLREIEAYSLPAVDAPVRDPWRFGKEHARRRRELSAVYRGELVPPWHNY